ncbi:kinase-like protein [Gigaspora margarita]|uniref:Kinase-like protein n=1 Tax=Gigaspora margarita TaxID=4874 RepID=A0A8H4ELM0_GIGMA|nr:kinase-like protein [Gigaspora margarita]
MSDTVICIVETTAEILALYNPIIGTINLIVREVREIYKNAESNKEICLIMFNRVDSAEHAMNTLMRNIEGSEDEEILENFRKKEYYLAFERFKNLLTNIKEYTNKVSKFDRYKQIINATEVKNKYEKLTKEYDMCIKDLQFTMIMSNEAARVKEAKKVDKAIENTEEALKKLDNTDQKLDMIAKNIDFLMKDKSHDAQVKKIDPSELSEPPYKETNFRRNVAKKIYKGEYEEHEVAYKPIDSQNLGTELTILKKLKSKFILQFYGLSYVDNNEVMISEWAEKGTLKELYNKHDIPWTRKIQIIRDICRGIVFLRRVNIFHHDLRCENVFVLQNLDPKIGNFKFAREIQDKTKNLSNILPDVIRWMAPELIKTYTDKLTERNSGKKAFYTFNCEMFSFGMLIWELCYEKIPYESMNNEPMNIKQISDHVLSGKREKLLAGKFDDPTDKIIQEKFINIIDKVWRQTPQQRMDIAMLNREFEQLSVDYPISPTDRMLFADKELNLDGTMNKLTLDFIPLEKGIEFHKKKDHANAWKSFNQNADLNNVAAKYWKGYYLTYEYDVVEKDLEQARKLFREAADNDYADAQCRYAVSLLSNLKNFNENEKDKHFEEILHYFKLAADNKNVDAMYYLGDIYVSGKLKVPKDHEHKELGLKYLNSAANQKFEKAIKLLKELNLDEKV